LTTILCVIPICITHSKSQQACDVFVFQKIHRSNSAPIALLCNVSRLHSNSSTTNTSISTWYDFLAVGGRGTVVVIVVVVVGIASCLKPFGCCGSTMGKEKGIHCHRHRRGGCGVTSCSCCLSLPWTFGGMSRATRFRCVDDGLWLLDVLL
jgi:hypothetical protein